MSTTKKVLIAIFSIVIIGAFAFLITWGIINFNKVKDGLAGTGLYTKDDIDKAYDDGYNTALGDKGDYEQLIEDYKNQITNQADSLLQSQNSIEELNNSIKELNSQITTMQNEAYDLQDEISQRDKQITQLNLQIDSLNATVEQLKTTNEANIQVISSLNSQILLLNNQINDLNNQIQIKASSVVELNDKIQSLQQSIAFYEEYISKLTTDDQALVTFEFAGSVYNVQVVDKGGKVTVVDPTSTEYLIFNGWTYNNELIDLSEFTVTESVHIIADVTYKYVVKFMAEGQLKSTQVVEQGQYVTEPTKPRKTGYSFEYWTIDGETQVFFDQYPITHNTTFVAKFTPLYDVSFVYEGETLTTRRVKENATTTPYAVTSTEYKVFNGWKVNGVIVDVVQYRITENTVFVADITYKFKVTFWVDGKSYNNQAISENGRPQLPTTPTKTGYTFMGWKVKGTESIIDVTKYSITENTDFEAVFKHNGYSVTFKNGNTVIATQTIEAGNCAVEPYSPSKQEHIFKGWSVDGTNVVDVSTYKINSNTVFVAVFEPIKYYIVHDILGDVSGTAYIDYPDEAAAGELVTFTIFLDTTEIKAEVTNIVLQDEDGEDYDWIGDGTGTHSFIMPAHGVTILFYIVRV